MFHDFGARGVGAHGQAAADDLAKRQHVRLDVVQARRTFEAHAEPADDLVKKEQNAFSRADATHLPQEVGILDEEAVVGGDGFDGDDSDLVLVLGDARLERLEVVQREDQGLAGVSFGHARGGGRAEGGQATARLHKQSIDVAVVAPIELDDFVSARDAACQANGGHGRFRAGRHKANAVGVPVVGQNQFSSSFSRRVGVPKEVPLANVAVTRSTTAGCAWPKMSGPHEQQKSMNSLPSASQMWAPCPCPRTKAFRHRFEGPHRRVHAAGKQGLGLVEQSRRRRRWRVVAISVRN